MTTDTWHVPDDLLVRYVNHPARVEPVIAASLEQHLIGCERCRSAVADESATVEVDALWREIADAVDRQPSTRFGRLLATAGLDRRAVRLVAATSRLQAQALAALAVVTAGALAAASQLDTTTPFLALAPLAILGVVTVAFWPSMEPGGEVSRATPVFGFGLFLTRTAVVLAASILPVIGASLLLPGPATTALAWVLPALALALGALALGTRYPPSTTAPVLAVVWVLGLTTPRMLRGPTLDLAWMQSPLTQAVALTIAAGSLVLLVLRRDEFDQLDPSTGGILG
jgi:hypothetical protein